MALTAIQRRWVRALDSGNYKQTRGKLHDNQDNSFCCLGVLCELAALEGVIPPYDESAGYDHNHVCLPPKVMQWVGLQSSWGNFGAEELARKNDEGAPFSEIADIIESEPEGLFVTEAA